MARMRSGRIYAQRTISSSPALDDTAGFEARAADMHMASITFRWTFFDFLMCCRRDEAFELDHFPQGQRKVLDVVSR